jgi:hypothetical protein
MRATNGSGLLIATAAPAAANLRQLGSEEHEMRNGRSLLVGGRFVTAFDGCQHAPEHNRNRDDTCVECSGCRELRQRPQTAMREPRRVGCEWIEPKHDDCSGKADTGGAWSTTAPNAPFAITPGRAKRISRTGAQ